MKEDDKKYLELVNKFKSDEKVTEADIRIMERWKFAYDSQVNDFLMGKDLEQAIIDKFNVSVRTAKYDVENSKKYFITEEMIDKTYWRGLLLRWQMKGLQLSYAKDQIKEFNAGIRNLYLILGLHKTGKNIDPKLLQQNTFNFFTESKRVGVPQIEEADIIELVEEIIRDENVTKPQKEKILRDAGVDRSETE